MSVPQLLFVETVDANSVPGDSAIAHLEASARIAAERGFAALTVVRSDEGHLLTPPGFTDAAFDVHLSTGRAAAARTIETSMWGLPQGADYVAYHWLTAKLEDPERFLRIEDHRWPMLYLSDQGDTWGMASSPTVSFGSVFDVRIDPTGRSVISLESMRRDFVEHCFVWRQELGGDSRRLVASFPSNTAYFGDMSISLDGRWLLADSDTKLIDLDTGHVAGLGIGISAACWYPSAGPSAVLCAGRSDFNEAAELFILDLSTWAREQVGAAPRPIHGLQVSPGGDIVARMNDELEALRGGYFDHLVVTSDLFRSFDSVVPVTEPSGWRRRATRPRWTEQWPAGSAGTIRLDGRFEEFLRAEAPATSLTPDTFEEALEASLPRIRHRLARLQEEPAMATQCISELRALTEWFCVADDEFAASVREQVVPVIRHAVEAAGGRVHPAFHETELIDALASGRRPPHTRLVFGP